MKGEVNLYCRDRKRAYTQLLKLKSETVYFEQTQTTIKTEKARRDDSTKKKAHENKHHNFKKEKDLYGMSDENSNLSQKDKQFVNL